MIVIEDELASQNRVGGNIALDQRIGAQNQNGDFGTKGFAVNPEWMEGAPLCYGNVEGQKSFLSRARPQHAPPWRGYHPVVVKSPV